MVAVRAVLFDMGNTLVGAPHAQKVERPDAVIGSLLDLSSLLEPWLVEGP